MYQVYKYVERMDGTKVYRLGLSDTVTDAKAKVITDIFNSGNYIDGDEYSKMTVDDMTDKNGPIVFVIEIVNDEINGNEKDGVKSVSYYICEW